MLGYYLQCGHLGVPGNRWNQCVRCTAGSVFVWICLSTVDSRHVSALCDVGGFCLFLRAVCSRSLVSIGPVFLICIPRALEFDSACSGARRFNARASACAL